MALGQVLKPKVEIVRPTINSPYLDPLSPQVLLKVLAFIVRRKDLEKLLLEGMLDGHNYYVIILLIIINFSSQILEILSVIIVSYFLLEVLLRMFALG